jgi:type III pantothenate kinase
LSFLLTIDVGNSRIKFGLFLRESLQPTPGTLPVCMNSLAVAMGEPVPWPELFAWQEGFANQPPISVLAGVNPPGIDKLLADWPRAKWPTPTVLRSHGALPLAVRVDAPEKVGIDRLLNAVAGNVLREADRAMIIVDSGTATTVDYVGTDGAFEGGAILPGFELSAHSLHNYTALLPFVPTAALAQDDPQPLGRNTRDAIRSGLFWGHVGAVKEIVSRLASRTNSEPSLLLTGGGAGLLAPHLGDRVEWTRHLQLQGMALAAARS